MGLYNAIIVSSSDPLDKLVVITFPPLKQEGIISYLFRYSIYNSNIKKTKMNETIEYKRGFALKFFLIKKGKMKQKGSIKPTCLIRVAKTENIVTKMKYL